MGRFVDGGLGVVRRGLERGPWGARRGGRKAFWVDGVGVLCERRPMRGARPGFIGDGGLADVGVFVNGDGWASSRYVVPLRRDRAFMVVGRSAVLAEDVGFDICRSSPCVTSSRLSPLVPRRYFSNSLMSRSTPFWDSCFPTAKDRGALLGPCTVDVEYESVLGIGRERWVRHGRLRGLDDERRFREGDDRERREEIGRGFCVGVGVAMCSAYSSACLFLV